MITEKEIIVGKNINLRNVCVEDPEFILNLRLNPTLNLHLSAVNSEIAAQEEWIEKYKKREGTILFHY